MIKCLTLAALHATLLGGCVVAPYGYRDYDDHHYWRHDDYRHDYYDLGYSRREWWNH